VGQAALVADCLNHPEAKSAAVAVTYWQEVEIRTILAEISHN
jgi:hypothetical protein